MKLVEFDLQVGGNVAINPEHVAAVIRKMDGGSVIRLVGRTEDIHVMEFYGDVVTAFAGEAS